MISKLKTIYSVFYRLVALAWAVALLASDNDPNSSLFWVAVVIALIPELQFAYSRTFKRRPFEFERAPGSMLLFAGLFIALLLLTDETYKFVVPSVAIVLGFVLHIQWAQVAAFDSPIDKTVAVPEPLKAFDLIHVCAGPSNPYDWPLFHFLRKSKSNSALVCSHAGEWRNEWILDGNEELEFVSQVGVLSDPPGGHGVIVLKDGEIFEVFRSPNRRARVPLVKIKNSLESRG